MLTRRSLLHVPILLVHAKTRIEASSHLSPGELVTIDPATGLRVLPPWLAQPYFRPLHGSGVRADAVPSRVEVVDGT